MNKNNKKVYKGFGISCCINSVAFTSGIFAIAASGIVNAEETKKIETNTIKSQEQAIEKIIVTGSRAATASSLLKQRDSETISTVISADISGKFPDSTVAETLRRAPGISFQRAERGGEGQFVSIRGLDSGLNNTKINGVNSATASGSRDRRVAFDVFQPGTVSEIIINKTLLPEHDGDGIGGAVELKTRNPFEVTEQQINVEVQGRYSEFRGETSPEFSLSYSNVFGANDNVALTAGFTSRERSVRSYQFDLLGDPVPLGVDQALGQSRINDIVNENPSVTPADFPFNGELGVEDSRINVFDNDKKNFASVLGLGWKISEDTTWALNWNYNKGKEENIRSTIGFEQSERYDLAFDPSPLYGSGPKLKIRAEVEDEERVNQTLSFQGSTITDKWEFDYGTGYSNATFRTPNSVEVDFEIDDLQDDSPLRHNTGQWDELLAERPELDAPFTDTIRDGKEADSDGNRYIESDLNANADHIPAPLLTDAGFLALNEPRIAQFDDLVLLDEGETNDRYSMYFNAKYYLDHDWLESIKVGTKWERSEFNAFQTRGDNGPVFDGQQNFRVDGTYDPDARSEDFTLADTNFLNGKTISFSDIGNPIPGLNNIYEYDRSAIRAYGAQARSSLNAQGIVGNSEELDTEENVYSTFIQAHINYSDDIAIIAGLRVEHYAVDTNFVTTNFSSAINASALEISDSASNTEILPRIQINYTYGDDWVIRGAYSTALARPVMQDLAEFTARGSADESGVDLVVGLPNPDLEAAYSQNFDLSAEYYFEQGVIGISAFYKQIDNFIFNGEGSSGASSADKNDILNILGGLDDLQGLSPDEIEVSFNQPINGRQANVVGMEFNLIYQFEDILPSFWSGFGIYTNLTLQNSEIELDIDTFPEDHPTRPGETLTSKESFFGAPDYIGNAAITYNKFGIDAALSYSFQDKQLVDIEDHLQRHEYLQGYKSLDLTVQYTFLSSEKSGEYTVFFSVNDINNSGDRAINHRTVGRSERYLDLNEFIGREFRLGVRAQF